MIDRVEFPGGDAGRIEADLIGFVGIDGTVHAVLRLDNGKYRSVSLLHIERAPHTALERSLAAA